MAKSYTKNVLNINKHQGNLTEATLRYYPTLEWLLFKKKKMSWQRCGVKETLAHCWRKCSVVQ